MSLLIAPFTHGLPGAAFPTTGIPEIPKPRLSPLDPTVRIVGGIGSGAAGSNTAGGISERMSRQWSGTLAWPGTEFTRMGEGNACVRRSQQPHQRATRAHFFLWNFCQLKAYIHALIQTRINMACSVNG